MSLAKVIELVGEGNTMEEAVENVIAEASKTLHNIRGLEIIHFHAVINDNKVTKYRVNAKVAFGVQKGGDSIK